jgi:hypothetical protein
MLRVQAEGPSVASDVRNTKTVVFLIGSMTIGAAVLLWLEPPTPGWSPATLLMAESARAVDEVRIDYVTPDGPIDPEECDCAVLPSGACVWRPQGSRIRLAVIGSEASELSQAQAQTLLAVFGTLTQRHGLQLERVWLHPASDARLHPELPAQAHDLCDLLVRKGIVP